MMSCNRSSMRNLIQNVLERSSKIGRTWVGLNDNELWLSKDDNDTTSNVKLQKKKKLAAFFRRWLKLYSLLWMNVMVNTDIGRHWCSHDVRKQVIGKKSGILVFVRRAKGQYYFWSMSASWLVGQRLTSFKEALDGWPRSCVSQHKRNNLLFLLHWKTLAWLG